MPLLIFFRESRTKSLCKWHCPRSRADGKSGRITSNAGDLIFFDRQGDGITEHVGIVVSVTDGIVNTIEGDGRNMCRRKSYSVGE